MEYQALARKYRPRNFASLMGQEHVSKALGNALRSQRLHHAYLFSGTRGVGKTTIARILAKSLNCETGIVAEPCGVCSTCKEIDEGRFIDLIEVDAASKTKVEDTRDMLDNVQYAPVRGRFKIYLIDEVHMLSGHSFNALLKTLEEPPEHVKFLLATTDPQKLPITVLSRCLQFNLRHLSLQQISLQLSKVLELEKFTFETDAIAPIAQAADGSMRDALSLLDQAIAFADGNLTLKNIDAMLGNVPTQHITGILSALIASNAQQVMNNLEEILNLGMGVDNVLIELVSALQKMAMQKILSNAKKDQPSAHQISTYEQQVTELSKQISAEDIQLYYQIALSGRADLELSPFPQAALEMVLLRMLAFRPVNVAMAEQLSAAGKVNTSEIAQKKKPLADTQLAAPSPIFEKLAEKNPEEKVQNVVETTTANVPVNAGAAKKDIQPSVEKKRDLDSLWNDCVYQISCVGIEKEILLHCSLLEKHQVKNKLVIKLGLDYEHRSLLNNSLSTRLEERLEHFFSQKCGSELDINSFSFSITILAENTQAKTPKQIKQKKLQQQLDNAKKSIAEDDNVQLLIKQFSGKIIADSIQPLN